MKTMKQELNLGFAECPFCKKHRPEIERKFDGGLEEGDEDFFYWIECGYCGAQGPASKTKEMAIESWNKGAQISRKELVGLVNKQAEDEGLWFVAETASEGYLQQELRKLHAAIESTSLPEEDKLLNLLHGLKRLRDRWGFFSDSYHLECCLELDALLQSLNLNSKEGE